MKDDDDEEEELFLSTPSVFSWNTMTCFILVPCIFILDIKCFIMSTSLQHKMFILVSALTLSLNI